MGADNFIVKKLNQLPTDDFERDKSRSIKRPGYYVLEIEGDKGVYAGSSSSITKRMQRHKSDLTKGNHPIAKLQEAFDNGLKVTARVVFTPTREEAFDREQELIDTNASNPKLLNTAMNARFSRAGLTPSEENIQRIKETHTGKLVSLETRNKLSAANMGKTHTDETKQLLSVLNTGRKHSDESKEKNRIASTGRTHTDEARSKISQAKKGLGFPKEALASSLEKRCKKVIVNDVEYSSFTEASKALNVSDVCVKNWAKSDKPQHAHVKLKEE